jgi:hypothetical protein
MAVREIFNAPILLSRIARVNLLALSDNVGRPQDLQKSRTITQ